MSDTIQQAGDNRTEPPWQTKPYRGRHRADPYAFCRWCRNPDGYLVAVPYLYGGGQVFEHPRCRPDGAR